MAFVSRSESHHKNSSESGAAKARRGKPARGRRNVALSSAITEIMAVESRTLFATISVTNFGAPINTGQNAQPAIQAALNSAHSGDTVSLPAGSYTINGSLDVPTGVTVAGAGYTSTHLTFTLASTGYGFVLDNNDSNVTIEGLDVSSNYGFVDMNGGTRFNNISIVGNSVEVGRGVTNNVWVAGIYDSVPTDNLSIEYNFFHNGPSGIRMFYLWEPTNSRVDYNLFYDVWDCGQVLASATPGDVFDYSYNYGTLITNKGLEMQSLYSGEKGDAFVTDNVFYDWLNPVNETFGLSVVPDQGSGNLIQGNYLSATLAPGSEPIQGHWGYGIEYGGPNGTVSDNTLIGPWDNPIVISGADATISGNQIYGPYQGPPYNVEPGLNPSFTVGPGNTVDRNQSDAPAPPANTFAGPAFWDGTTVTIPPSEPASGSGGISSGGGSSGSSGGGNSGLPTSGDGGLNGVGSSSGSGSNSGTGDGSSSSGSGDGGSSSGSGSSFGGGIGSGGIGSGATTGDGGLNGDGSNSSGSGSNSGIGATTGDGGLNSGDGSSSSSSASPFIHPSSGDSGLNFGGSTQYSSSVANPRDLPITDGTQMAPLPTDGPFTYISDMPFDAVKNGWGPVERDESNGETAANDGHLITMDGVTYSKGIGMHAAGEIVVPLDDEYSTFKASIGIDDETIPHVGRADIEIWGDGKELASTGTVKTGEKAVNLIVNVTGVEYLSIVAKEVGGNNYYAHVDLGYARVYPVTNTNITGVDAPASSALPVPVTTSVVSSSSTFLSDMPMTQISNGFGNAQRDLADGGMDSAGGTPLTIDGTVYNKGLGVNADSDLQFSLNGDYKTFSSEIGIDDESGGQGAVDFEVLADGKLIYNSGMVLGGQAATPISLNVSGVKTLDLVVVNAQDGIDYDNADWVDAQVST